MSNRFHNKFHRHNHHTAPTDRDGLYPDSAYDPIASRESPFQGEFYSVDQITTTDSVLVGQTLSATDGRFTQNVRIDNYLTVFNDISAGRNIIVDNDVWISGNLTVLGDTTQLDTLVYATSALSVVNSGTGPAVFVKQTGNQPVAQFFDDDIPALVIDGRNSAPGYVGINTLTPNEQLTIVGNISGINSRVSFNNSLAQGVNSFGVNTGRALGNYSVAEGDLATAEGYASHAEGVYSLAKGNVSRAEGFNCFAFGDVSHAEGGFTYSLDVYSHAEGIQTVAAAPISHAEGYLTTTGRRVPFSTFTKSTNVFTFTPLFSSFFLSVAPNTRLVTFISNVGYSFLVASVNQQNGSLSAVSVSIPSDINASSIQSRYIITREGNSSHSEGYLTQAIGNFSHAEGDQTTASGIASHAEGSLSLASSFSSHAEGRLTIASGSYSHAEGEETTASGYGSHAEGKETTASGEASHAEGIYTIASGEYSHAEGSITMASGNASHVEGWLSLAAGGYSHAEGYGSYTTPTANAGHAEGILTVVYGEGGHAEGSLCEAKGDISHAGGYRATAAQNYTYAWTDGNLSTISQNVSTTRTGQYMISASGGVFIPGNVGIGTDDPSSRVHIDATDAIIIPVGNISQRVNVKGAIRYNSELSAFEGYGENVWGTLGGVRDTDQDTYIIAEDSPGSDNDQLKFFTADQQRMIVDSNGNVGIGTSSPNEQLTVTGNISGNNLRTSFNQGSATGDYSFAQNNGKAIGAYSHAEGIYTIASGDYSHAEGASTIASGNCSHAQGLFCRSQAEGSFTTGWSNNVTLNSEYGIALGNNSRCDHARSYIWSAGSFGTANSENSYTTRAQQYMVNAPVGGIALYGNVGVGTDSIENALTVVGDVSASGTLYGKAQDLVLDATSTNTIANSAITAALQLLSPAPVYTAPTASLTPFSPSVFEVGQTVSQTLTLDWTQNDAGSRGFWRLTKDGVTAVQDTALFPQTFNVSEPATLSTTTYQLSVNFGTGVVKNNVLGFPDTRGQITANAVTINRSYTGYYRRWIGSDSTFPTSPASIRSLGLTTTLDTNNTLASQASPIYVDSKFILIAIPNTKSLVSVITEANENLTSQFNLSSLQIPDAGSTLRDYKLYYLETALPLNANLTTVTIA